MEIGLTSVTFRRLGYNEIIDYCGKCGISCIEWGSDVHAPEGNAENAKSIRAATYGAGLAVSSYGSYYRVGTYDRFEEEFEKYLVAAKALEATVIRVWAGRTGSKDADKAHFEGIVAETKAICDMAARLDIDIAFEYHENTLADSRESVKRLLDAINKRNIGVYFQYSPTESIEENIETLKELMPYVRRVHVFNIDKNYKNLSLKEGEGIRLWRGIIDVLKKEKPDARLLIEFLKDSSLDGLMEEVKILKELLK